METHHCFHCYNLLFVCQQNAYPSNTQTISIERYQTLHIGEIFGGFITCERCKSIVGELNNVGSYNIFLERINIFNTEQNCYKIINQ